MTARNDDLAAEDVFTAMAGAVAPAELAQSQRTRMRASILQRIADQPPPSGTTTWRSAEPGWADGLPRVQLKVLRVDETAGMQEVLIRFLPGAVIPAHSHVKEEQMIILEGECMIGEHRLGAGDVHVAPPGSWHPPITSDKGTLLLLRCEYPFPVDR
jgi:quercetin dioxygenase-like cupin family protein